MKLPADAASLSELTPAELAALRLAAQVMSHRALLAGTPAAALYFDSLATAVDGEQAARAQTPQRGGPEAASDIRRDADGVAPAVTPLLIESGRGDEDRRVIGEYLALLATNERLPAAVRDVCHALEASFRQ